MRKAGNEEEGNKGIMHAFFKMTITLLKWKQSRNQVSYIHDTVLKLTNHGFTIIESKFVKWY